MEPCDEYLSWDVLAEYQVVLGVGVAWDALGALKAVGSVPSRGWNLVRKLGGCSRPEIAEGEFVKEACW